MDQNPGCATSSAPSNPKPQFDPLRAHESFEYRCVFYPLGFAVEIETNSEHVLAAAHESWSEHTVLDTPEHDARMPRLRIGVTASEKTVCPPAVAVRAFGHLLSVVADAENFVMCDLLQGFAFGWVSEACLRHRAYLRYHFLEAAVMCLLVGTRVTPIHAGCVSYNGRGLLLCGDSGAGKSTLSYACARAGFPFTTDDASYVVWHGDSARVRGNAHQVRFRPSAREIFPELRGLSLTPRVEGKPSIEGRTRDLYGVTKAPEVSVHAVLLLRRHAGGAAELLPISYDEARPYLEASLFPLEGVRDRQACALRVFRDIPMYEFRYGDLDAAVDHLRKLCSRDETMTTV